MEETKFKHCKKCQQNHPLTKEYWYFYSNGRNACRTTVKERRDLYREKNRESLLIKQREKYRNNPKYHTEKRKKNREKNREYLREYRIKNKEKIKQLNKKWRENNKEYIRDKHREYISKNPKKKGNPVVWDKEKYRNNISFRIKVSLRNRIRAALKNRFKTGSVSKELGGIDEAIKHIESMFHDNPVTGEKMNWNNWGVHGWHLDHIKPLSFFDLEDPEEFKAACHFSNLQPLWAKENLSKGDSFNSEIDLERLLRDIDCNYEILNGVATVNKHEKSAIVRSIPLIDGEKCKQFLSEKRCFQFFPEELRNKKEIVKSILLNFFGDSIKINGRECAVSVIKNSEANVFFNKNHLMGYHPTSSYVGLFHKEVMVSCIGYKKNGSGIEISRFANLTGHTVRGGFSKLLKYLEKNVKIKEGGNNAAPKYIISYCDLRYSSGDSYEKTGFKETGEHIGFWWTNKYKVFNRLRCRANMDERGLSQKEHAKELGLFMIYDCGHTKYIKTLKPQ